MEVRTRSPRIQQSSDADRRDTAAARSGAIEEVAGLVEALKAPVFTTPMGKGSVNEQLPSFKGTYSGAGSKPDIISVVEGSDCVLWIGRYPVSCRLSSRQLRYRTKAD